MVQLRIVSGSGSHDKIRLFVTNVKSNSSSIGNVEGLLGIELGMCGQLLGIELGMCGQLLGIELGMYGQLLGIQLGMCGQLLGIELGGVWAVAGWH